MNIIRGAISKITKKLPGQNLIEWDEEFMKAFNDYLEAQIIKLGGNADEN